MPSNFRPRFGLLLLRVSRSRSVRPGASGPASTPVRNGGVPLSAASPEPSTPAGLSVVVSNGSRHAQGRRRINRMVEQSEYLERGGLALGGRNPRRRFEFCPAGPSAAVAALRPRKIDLGVLGHYCLAKARFRADGNPLTCGITWL